MSKSLVLGGNGFVGHHLVDSLVEAGHDVRAFDRFSLPPKFKHVSDVEKMAGDYMNRGELEAAVEDVETVYHFISTTNPATAELDPLADVDNIRMSIELFRLCVRLKTIKNIVFASTSAIYGDSVSPQPFSEEALPKPISPYAIGKQSIEGYLASFKKQHEKRREQEDPELNVVSLRISNPYGEGQPLNRKQGVIPIFLGRIATKEPLHVMGDGSMVRDYIYVRDMTDMIAAMLSNEEAPKHDLYNIGSGVGVSVNEIVANARQVTGEEPEIKNISTPPTFAQEVVFNTERIQSEFGLKPATSLLEGMERTYESILRELRDAK